MHREVYSPLSHDQAQAFLEVMQQKHYSTSRSGYLTESMVSAANFCGKQIEIAKRARKPALPKATNEYINKYNNTL